MTAAFAAGVAVGWLSLAAAGVFLLGAAIRMADAQAAQQPEGVRDPETGAVWTESKRLGEVWL